ncbi:hypothetical protein ABFY60_10805 [Lysinibacillus pakistanensis]|uniref:hypothetical protein n=1 Tax=Lysinibacillus pakistanensis TaxID=759811 RepID=UPI003D2E254A
MNCDQFQEKLLSLTEGYKNDNAQVHLSIIENILLVDNSKHLKLLNVFVKSFSRNSKLHNEEESTWNK